MASSDPPAGSDREVLAGLPNSRPTRRSAKRDGAGGRRAPRAASEAPAKPQRSAARGTAKPRAAAKRSGTGEAAGASPAATSGARGATAPRRPAPKAAPIPPAGYATPRTDDDAPCGADLVTTAVQAAGELAHIAIATAGRALKSALQRLPRP